MKLTPPSGKEGFLGPHMLLPADKARHVGEAVAMVVAETEEQALDAAEAVQIDYEELPFVTDERAALEPGAPAVWDEVPDNCFIDTMFGDVEATDRAFAAADHVVKMDFHIGRVTAVTMEPRAALGAFDPDSGRYALHAGSGGAVRQKHELAYVLGVAPSQLRVQSYDVGGNFGSKNRPYVEYGLVLWASRKIGRPVKYTATRSETFLSDYQGRDLVTSVELALDRGGRFLALRADNISNVGARCVSLSPLSKGAGLITGSYDIPAATLRARAVFTNTMMTQAYRSSGRPEVNFAIERLVDTAARELGFDRVELRRKNLVRPEAMPYTNAVGMTYDSGTYEANMDAVMRLADWDGFPARKRGGRFARQAARPRHGALCRVLDRLAEGARRDHGDAGRPGRHGDRHAAERPGPRDELRAGPCRHDLRARRVHQRDHGRHRHRQRRRRLAFRPLHAPCRHRHRESLDGPHRSGQGDRGRRRSERRRTKSNSRTAASACRAPTMPSMSSSWRGRPPSTTLPDELKDGLAVKTDNEMHEPVFPNGCAVCEVEVDPQTGAIAITRYATVDDVGRCINPLIVHGQTHGGIAQGVGQAMWEQLRLDASGQPISASLMDYGMPRFDNLPSFRTEIAEVLSPTNPLGIKAGGEGGTTPALSVMVNAVVDALAELGVADITMPLTPLTVWEAIQNAKRKAAA